MANKDRLSILQVCSASQAVYGAVQSLLTLTEYQRRAGHSVEFLTFKGKRFGAEVRALDYPVHEVRVRAKIDPAAILRMRNVIRSGGFDLVHTHLSTSSVNGCLAARLARVPCVATVHGMSGKLSFAAADHLIGVSHRVKDHLVAQGIRPEKVSVVHNGLSMDFPIADRAEARARLNFEENDLLLGTVSRVTALKGIDDAIRAVKLLTPEFPTLRYLVVGDGDALVLAQQLVEELGLKEHVRFAGYQSEVGQFLPAMDVFLFPSKKEAMGIALVEAMAVGLPCVASDVDGIPEVISDDSGVLVPAGDPQSLADATGRLLRDASMRHEMGLKAKARVLESFSAEAMESATDWVYRSLVGDGVPLPRATAQAVEGRFGARR